MWRLSASRAASFSLRGSSYSIAPMAIATPRGLKPAAQFPWTERHEWIELAVMTHYLSVPRHADHEANFGIGIC